MYHDVYIYNPIILLRHILGRYGRILFATLGLFEESNYLSIEYAYISVVRNMDKFQIYLLLKPLLVGWNIRYVQMGAFCGYKVFTAAQRK